MFRERQLGCVRTHVRWFVCLLILFCIYYCSYSYYYSQIHFYFSFTFYISAAWILLHTRIYRLRSRSQKHTHASRQIEKKQQHNKKNKYINNLTCNVYVISLCWTKKNLNNLSLSLWWYNDTHIMQTNFLFSLSDEIRHRSDPVRCILAFLK